MRRESLRTPWLLLLLICWLTPAAIRAERVGVIGLRAAAGTLSPSVLRQADDLIWQRLSSMPGVQAVREEQIGSQLGGAYELYRACAEDGCMRQLGLLAGVERLVWVQVQRTREEGFTLVMRAIGFQPDRLDLAAAQCARCGEAELLGLLLALEVAPLKLGLVQDGGPRSTPPASGPPPMVPPPAAPAAGPATFPPAVAAPVWGWLTVESEPTGASVFIGDQLLGYTPILQRELPPGVHTLLFRYPEHHMLPLAVQVQAGRPARIMGRLKPAYGFLSIDSHPRGAQLLVNGQPVGRTPYSRTKVGQGTYEVIAILEGFAPQQKQVVIADVRPVQVTFRFRASPGPGKGKPR